MPARSAPRKDQEVRNSVKSESNNNWLERYLYRLGMTHRPSSTDESLAQLHAAHAERIPFENFDLHVRPARHVSLQLDDIVCKLVDERRGGCCYEQNILLGAALETLGFRVHHLTARNLRSAPSLLLPKTHMCLLVGLADRQWLVDVGFGAHGLHDPIPFEMSAPRRSLGDTYRLVPDEQGIHLQIIEADAWKDIYAFRPYPTPLIDFEVLNHYISTHPQSRFLRQPVAAILTSNARVSLAGPLLTTQRVGEKSVREAASSREYGGWLERFFNFRREDACAFASMFWPRLDIARS